MEHAELQKKLVFRTFAIVLLVALFLAILLAQTAHLGAEYSLQSVRTVEADVTETGVGYLFRDEIVLGSTNIGPVAYLAPDGAAVAAGEDVAAVFQDDSGTDKRERAAVFYREIERLDACLDGVGTVWQPEYAAAYREMMASLSAGDFSAAEAPERRVAAAAGIYAAEASSVSDIFRARVASLGKEIEDLVRNVDEAEPVSAPAAGTFFRETDGYETWFGAADAASLTPEILDSLLSMRPISDSTVGKIVLTGVWHLAFPTTAEKAAAFTAGSSYPVTFEDGVSRELLLSRVSVSGDRAVLVFDSAGRSAPAGSARARRVSVSLGKESGFSLPSGAVYEEGEDSFVFVLEDGVARRRSVTPGADGRFYTAAEENGLREGDVLIVAARKMEDGKVLIPNAS